MSEGLFENVYNPDVLSCLANLSSDEVFTPPSIANAMLDMLPQEIFSNPDTRILDPACKSGVFLREAAKRFDKGLEKQIPDREQRFEHIFKKQLFGIAITELTSLISRRSVYCSAYPNSKYSVARFDDAHADGNIRFKRIEHLWKDGKCSWCGAAQAQYDRSEDNETHAYEFIHCEPKELYDMKFDVIISNPPYQLSDGGNGASASPLYHKFVEQAIKMSPEYLIMIIPARWYAGGKGLDEFRNVMLNQKHIKELVDIPNSADCFPGVNVAGGLCYFLWSKHYSGDCNVSNMEKGQIINSTVRSLNEYDYFVRNNTALHIIRKCSSDSQKKMSDVVFSRNCFNIPTTVAGKEEPFTNSIKILSSKGIRYVEKTSVFDKEFILQRYKVVITYAMSGGNKPSTEGNYQVISSLKILEPNEACTETYLVINTFPNRQLAENLITYVKSKTFRFLLLQALTSIHITKDKFCYVPMQDFTKPWTDEELYAKYNLTQEEIDFIESMIKPMEIGGDDNG